MTTPNLGSLEPLQPLIEQLREQAARQNGGRVGAYAFGAHSEGQELYFWGLDGAGREFAFRFLPDAFDEFVQKALGTREMGAQRRRELEGQ